MNELAVPTLWTPETYNSFITKLETLKDDKYLEFSKKLTITKYRMIGIRVPVLRFLTKEIKKTNYEEFLKLIKHNTFEEIFIEGIIISYIKDYSQFLTHFKNYLNYIDNWAICDMVLSSMKIIGKNKQKFEKVIKKLLRSKNEFYVRVGIVSLLNYYIEKENLQKIFAYLDNINHSGYYVHMAIAWIVSILYIKYPKETEKYLKNNNLDSKTLNRAIQKIRESTRVSKKEKDYLLKYKK